jgi:ABC-type polysaccharide/polyol phosphate export permease
LFGAILWREWIGFKNKWLSISLSALVSPLLYLVAFGWGLGDSFSINNTPYGSFIMPGIIAMNAMTNGFSVIANDINMSRIYQKTFEAVMTSPVKMPVYVIARISAHVLRCLYAAFLIVLLSFAFRAHIGLDWYFITVLVLNCYVFSAIGFIAGILIDSHGDIAKVSSFAVTPMAFLCGTFFPLEKFPPGLKTFFSILPLSQTVNALRNGFALAGWLPLLALAVYLAALLPLAIRLCAKAE